MVRFAGELLSNGYAKLPLVVGKMGAIEVSRKVTALSNVQTGIFALEVLDKKKPAKPKFGGQ